MAPVTGQRTHLAAAWARPAGRRLRSVLLVAGTAIVGLRLLADAPDDGTVAAVVAVAAVAGCGHRLVTTLTAGLRELRSATLDAERPAATVTLLGVVATGGYVGGVLVLGALDRRIGPTWTLLVVLATVGWTTHRLRGRLAEAAPVTASTARPDVGAGPAALLELHDLTFGYGKVQVLHGVELSVDEGEMVALLGVNGAGKSTLLRAISGLGLPSGGTIRFAGEDITYLDAERRLRLGINQVPGGRAVFGPLSVVDNLRAYAYSLDQRATTVAVDRALETFPRLAERRDQLASTLSGGEQQMLALAKAVMLRPRLLLIDELSLGLAPVIVGELLDLVRRINDEGTAVVLVEQSVNIALDLAEHAYFMERGEVRFDGAAADLLERDDLLRAVFLEGAGGAS